MANGLVKIVTIGRVDLCLMADNIILMTYGSVQASGQFNCFFEDYFLVAGENYHDDL
jgi:hypothetical protein